MSVVQSIDHLALLPAYVAAGTAVLVLLTDLALARRGATMAVAGAGAAATVLVALLAGRETRSTFCVADGCSYLAGGRSALVAVVFGLLTLGVLALSAPALRAGPTPTGEYCFLLACSMTGGVVLGAAGDLITLIVALETLTLPLYVLVGLRRGSLASAEAAVTFFVVSVVATSVTLLGAALLYATTGTLHLDRLGPALTGDLPAPETASVAVPLHQPLTSAAVVLLVLGLAFKVAAVPLHAWAPTTYDGAPVPVAAYLSTASKFGGVVALLAVVQGPLPATRTGPVLAVLAVVTMTVGNLVALRQQRMVRLLAWSSVAQAGYILAPLGVLALTAGRTGAVRDTAVAAALAYAVLFVVLELAAFAAVVALRPVGADGGTIADHRGAGRRHPLVGAALVLALVGLAGLPPGLAGLFAKVVVVRALLDGGAGWLALVVAVNAVIGLAYYLRLAATLYTPALTPTPEPAPAPAGRGFSLPWPVAAAVTLTTLAALVLGFAPQLLLDATRW
ncbi:proton-conducting transporter membrane subunit [Micromonospora sp. CPCC 206060]|uniref:NADH-quinone oxidoreductase subunit N n=1 Tax=Micromonospora sp. CPCC 206060 TaxID=3122406 RepID=UPI002FF05F07